MSYIIQDSWHIRQVNSHSDMALMYQLEMNGQNNNDAVLKVQRFRNSNVEDMPKLIDQHFGQKGVLKSTKRFAGQYLSKLWDEELDDYYYCLWDEEPNWDTKTSSVRRYLEYHKNYFKLRTPISAHPQHGDWITGKTGVAFENVGVRKIVPAPFEYNEVENERYLEVMLNDKIRYCKTDQMLSFKYDKKPTTENQFITLPKYKVNRKKMNLVRKNFKDNDGAYFESMYKLIPEKYSSADKSQSVKELRELNKFPDKLTADEKRYVSFLQSVVDVNHGFRPDDKKASVTEFMQYHAKNLKKYHASKVLEAV